MGKREKWLELEAHWAARQRGEIDRREWSENMSVTLLELRRIFGYTYEGGTGR